MMKYRTKLIPLLFGLVLIASGVSACGSKQEEVQTSGIAINENMEIEALVVESFDETVYDVNELKAMMDSEANEYNSTNGAGKITAGEAVVTEGKVSATMIYQTAEDYASFNRRNLKLKELSEAVKAGDINVALRSTKEDLVVNPASIEDMSGLYLVVTDEVGTVTCPGKVQYISDGVEIQTKNVVSVTDNMDGLAYIVFKMK